MFDPHQKVLGGFIFGSSQPMIIRFFKYSGVRSDQDDSNMFKSSLVVLAAPSHMEVSIWRDPQIIQVIRPL